MDNNIKNSNDIARKIVAVLVEKKALQVKLYNVGEENPLTDYYVNATGRSGTQVLSLTDEVLYQLSLLGVKEKHVEGRLGNSWLLIDYGDVIVNVFDKESRDFYDFDRLLPAECEVDIQDIVSEIDEKYKIMNIEEL